MTWLKFLNYVCFVAVIFMSGCSASKSLRKNAIDEKYTFPYDINTNQIFELDKDLNEISGLSYDSVDDVLFAVEDEHGIVYKLNKTDGSVVERETFYKDGDYEGITNTQDHLYILKSSGTIYQVALSDMSSAPEKKKSFINKKYDAEGITYDASSHSLYICHKGSIDESTKNLRCVFRYDLHTEQMMEAPFVIIQREDVVTYLNDNYSTEYVQDNFKKIIDPDLDYIHLGPSAIAFHPQSGDIYLLSSQSKVLMVYDRQSKKINYIQKLNKEIFTQPEGICFDQSGTLYIANEAKKKKPKIVVLTIKK